MLYFIFVEVGKIFRIVKNQAMIVDPLNCLERWRGLIVISKETPKCGFEPIPTNKMTIFLIQDQHFNVPLQSYTFKGEFRGIKFRGTLKLYWEQSCVIKINIENPRDNWENMGNPPYACIVPWTKYRWLTYPTLYVNAFLYCQNRHSLRSRHFCG